MRGISTIIAASLLLMTCAIDRPLHPQVGQDTLAVASTELEVTWPGYEGRKIYTITDGDSVWKLTDTKNPSSNDIKYMGSGRLVLTEGFYKGDLVISHGQVQYAVEVSGEDDMTDRHWVGYQGGYESNRMNEKIVDEPGEFSITYSTIKFLNYGAPFAFYRYEHRFSGGEAFFSVERTMLEPICLWTEYTMSVPTSYSGNEHNFGTVYTDSAESETGLGQGAAMSDYIQLNPANLVTMVSDDMSVMITIELFGPALPILVGDHHDGRVVLYANPSDGLPELQVHGDVETFSHAITMEDAQ